MILSAGSLIYVQLEAADAGVIVRWFCQGRPVGILHARLILEKGIEL